MTLSVPVFGLKRDQLGDELGEEGGNDQGRSRGRGHMKNQAPKEARPRNSLEDLGKLARKTACKKSRYTLL